jgi:sporulation protein YunB
MIRNSILYRRYWYAKKRNATNIHIFSRLISVIIIFVLLLIYVEKLAFPYLVELSQNKAKETYIAAINSTIKTVLSEEKNNNNLVSSDSDINGRLNLLQINSLQIENFSYELTNLINKKLAIANLKETSLPFGSLTGISLLSNLGPIIHIKYSSYQNIETIVKHKLLNAKTTQPSHVIILQMKSCIGIKLPFKEEKYSLIVDVPMSETIILR